MARVEAVIVAGGFGTRLRPLTEHRPKHLLPVAGVPLVAHQLAKLAAAGVAGSCWRRAITPTSSSRPSATAATGASSWSTCARTSRSVPAGRSATSPNSLASVPDEPVVILNGDILSGHDLRRAAGPAPRAPRRMSPCTWSRSPTRARTAACRPMRHGRVDGVPREGPASGVEPDQRRLLRLRPAGDRRDPRRPRRVGRA